MSDCNTLAVYITKEIIKLRNRDIFIEETKKESLVGAQMLKLRQLYSLFLCERMVQNE